LQPHHQLLEHHLPQATCHCCGSSCTPSSSRSHPSCLVQALGASGGRSLPVGQGASLAAACGQNTFRSIVRGFFTCTCCSWFSAHRPLLGDRLPPLASAAHAASGAARGCSWVTWGSGRNRAPKEVMGKLLACASGAGAGGDFSAHAFHHPLYLNIFDGGMRWSH